MKDPLVKQLHPNKLTTVQNIASRKSINTHNLPNIRALQHRTSWILWFALLIKWLTALYKLKKEYCEHTFLAPKKNQSLFLVNVYYFYKISQVTTLVPKFCNT